MSEYDGVLTEDRGRIRLLTLNRPKQLNAFNDAQYDALAAALRAAAEHPRVTVAVITGSGRAFSAGQDLAELGQRPTYTDHAAHGFQPFELAEFRGVVGIGTGGFFGFVGGVGRVGHEEFWRGSSVRK